MQFVEACEKMAVKSSVFLHELILMKFTFASAWKVLELYDVIKLSLKEISWAEFNLKMPSSPLFKFVRNVICHL